MGSVLLVIHLLVAILLVTLILMQRNSGNALSGLGGGNGADSFLSARGKGNLLTKTTAILATIFFITSMALALYYKGETKKVDSITDVAPLTQTAPSIPDVPNAVAEETPATETVPEEASDVEQTTEDTAEATATTNAEKTVEEAPVTEQSSEATEPTAAE